MKTMSQMMAGRKRESPVWDLFQFDESSGKSLCLVQGPKDSKPCGVALAGKNSSNLVAHLQRFHKEAYSEYEEKLKKKETCWIPNWLRCCIPSSSTSGVWMVL